MNLYRINYQCQGFPFTEAAMVMAEDAGQATEKLRAFVAKHGSEIGHVTGVILVSDGITFINPT